MEQFVAPVELNFKPEHKNEMFGIPMERAMQMVDQWEEIVGEVVEDRDAYTIIGKGGFEGFHRLDEGAVLKRFVSIATNVNEWLFAIYSANPIFDQIRYHWNKRARANKGSEGGGLMDAIINAIKESQLQK